MLVRDRLQLRVAVSCSAPSHYIASSRIDDRVAHHAQHVVERHFASLQASASASRLITVALLGVPFTRPPVFARPGSTTAVEEKRH